MPFEGEIEDIAWEALTGTVEAALDAATELVESAPAEDYMFALRAEYLRTDGELVWVTLSTLAPLSELPLLVFTIAERGTLTITTGYWRDMEGVSIPAELVQVNALVKLAGE